MTTPLESPAETRLEHDSMGDIAVPRDRLWGAQTQRSLVYFRISEERMPLAIVRALTEIKRSAATVNARLGLLPEAKALAITRAADEVLAGLFPDEFPLSVWQTGSGTQSNMNVNEVLANRASEHLGGSRGPGRLVHPNDEVNLGQSSNDVFPTAMHVATSLALHHDLAPALHGLRATLAEKASAYADVVKIGRTHLQDATPLTLGQEISGWVAQLDHAQRALESVRPLLSELAIGGTAVGTGLNTHPRFGELVAHDLSERLGLPFRTAENRFAALASHEALLAVHGGLKTLAAALHKIANDVRWLASGPRAGLGELAIPENEPGSSIMPGKVNPTQCEAVTMLACQIFGNDVTVTLAGASGNFELNVFKPVIAYNVLQSVRLLADGMASFDTHCVAGLSPRPARMAELVERSLMLVTALAPRLGYERAAEIAKAAHKNGQSLAEAAVALGYASAEDVVRWTDPRALLGPRG
jgi:fumarate hydratase, class II